MCGWLGCAETESLAGIKLGFDLEPFFSAVTFLSVHRSSASEKPKPSGNSMKGTKGLKEGRAHQWHRAQLSYRIVLETLGENLQEDKD